MKCRRKTTFDIAMEDDNKVDEMLKKQEQGWRTSRQASGRLVECTNCFNDRT